LRLILVDDGSRDRSAEMLETAAAEHPDEIVAVFLNRNYGQHAAIMAGFEQVRGEIVVTLDADLQNPPEEIPRLAAAMDEGYDVVGSVRANRQDTLFRRTASALVNRAVQKATGVMMHDYGCMLRAYRDHIVHAMLMCHERSTFIPVLGNSFARRTTEIEVGHDARKKGDSKYSFSRLISLMFDLVTSMTTYPLRLLSFMGALVSARGHRLRLLPFGHAADLRGRMGRPGRLHPVCHPVYFRRRPVRRHGAFGRISRTGIQRRPRTSALFCPAGHLRQPM
jgi:undecaprenyl-phosphate 4-deoxy-4-formamido-L-arabinose transferase